MRVIALSNLRAYWRRHPDSRAALLHWLSVVNSAQRQRPQDALQSFSKAKVLSRDRVRFEIEGGDFRLIASFNFKRQVAYVKFIGTHAEYDRVDALTVSIY